MSLEYVNQEPVVIQEIETTNFDLLRLLNGGTMDSKGGLFSIRVVQKWKTKTKTNRDMIGLVFQIITKGINNPINRKDVIIKKVVEKQTIIKEIEKKPKTIVGEEKTVVMEAEVY